jgi:hypothetical protein
MHHFFTDKKLCPNCARQGQIFSNFAQKFQIWRKNIYHNQHVENTPFFGQPD